MNESLKYAENSDVMYFILTDVAFSTYKLATFNESFDMKQLILSYLAHNRVMMN